MLDEHQIHTTKHYARSSSSSEPLCFSSSISCSCCTHDVAAAVSGGGCESSFCRRTAVCHAWQSRSNGSDCGGCSWWSSCWLEAASDDANNCCRTRLRCNWSYRCCVCWGAWNNPMFWFCKVFKVFNMLSSEYTFDGCECGCTWFCIVSLVASRDWESVG